MKVDQKALVRWFSKRVIKRGEQAPRSVSQLRELDSTQLRFVSGGNTTQSPFKGW